MNPTQTAAFTGVAAAASGLIVWGLTGFPVADKVEVAAVATDIVAVLSWGVHFACTKPWKSQPAQGGGQ